MFAVPFAFARAGFVVGAGYLIVFTLVFALVHRMYAEIVIGTPGKHRFVGYAEIYLGGAGRWASMCTTAIGLTLVLTVYMALASVFTPLIFPGISVGLAAYLFWAAGSVAILASLGRLANAEFVATGAIVFIVLYLFVLGLPSGAGVPIPLLETSDILLPYGIVLFALSGRAAISSLFEYARKASVPSSRMFRAISLGTGTPAILYLIFAFAVFWLSKGNVSPDALTGLRALPYSTLALLGALGLFALFTSYFLLGLEVRDILRFDFRFHRGVALLAVLATPAALYALGLRNFIELVGVVGGVFLAAESAMVALMHSQLKGWSVYTLLLILIFIGGALYELAGIV